MPIAYSREAKRAFLENLDDRRHGTRTGLGIAYCTCDKCQEYRDEYNAKKREKNRLKRELEAKRRESRQKKVVANPKDVCTIDECFLPLMGRTSIKKPYCVVCGSTDGLEQHHPVKRSEGKWIRDGHEVRKPTLTLCRKCHAKVHSDGYLWFRWKWSKTGDWVDGTASQAGAGWYEFLELTKEQAREWMEAHPLPNGELPSRIGYMNALDMDGWRRIK